MECGARGKLKAGSEYDGRYFVTAPENVRCHKRGLDAEWERSRR